MEYIQQLFSWMMPTPVRCDDQFDVDLPHDQAYNMVDLEPLRRTIRQCIIISFARYPASNTFLTRST